MLMRPEDEALLAPRCQEDAMPVHPDRSGALVRLENKKLLLASATPGGGDVYSSKS